MAESIADTQLRLETTTKETNPDADISPGSVLSELVIKLAATEQNQLTNEISDLATAQSIDLALEQTPVNSTLIDQIASNFLVTRIQGTKSTGKIQVYVTASRNYILSTSFQFVQPSTGLLYTLPASVTASPSPGTNEVQLVQQGARYYFIVPVIAADVGSEYQVNNQTVFALADGTTLPNFVEAKAFGNFTSAQGTETDTELISRLKLGQSFKTLCSPVSVEATLKDLYPQIKAISIVGGGDPEMDRDTDNVFQMKTFGLANVYMRSSFGLETINVTLTATKTSATLNQWELEVTGDEVAGFYRLQKLLPTNANYDGTYPITSQTYGFDPALPGQRGNKLSTATQARFTKYQNLTLVFENKNPNYVNGAYTTTNAPIDSTDSVLVVLEYTPLVLEVQNLFLGNERIPSADYLVKAMMPCFVTMELNVAQSQYVDPIDIESLRQDIFNYINGIPLGDALVVSKIIDICHNYPIRRVDLPITVIGEFLGNDSSITTVSSTDILNVITDVDKGISPNTTMFFVAYDQLSVTVTLE